MREDELKMHVPEFETSVPDELLGADLDPAVKYIIKKLSCIEQKVNWTAATVVDLSDSAKVLEQRIEQMNTEMEVLRTVRKMASTGRIIVIAAVSFIAAIAGIIQTIFHVLDKS